MKSIINYIYESSSSFELSNEDNQKLEDFFKENIQNIGKIEKNNKKFSITFTFPKEVADEFNWDELSRKTIGQEISDFRDNKERIVITKPTRSNGGYNIMIFCPGGGMSTRWQSYNYGDKNKKKNSDEPLLANIDEVISKLENIFTKTIIPKRLLLIFKDKNKWKNDKYTSFD